MYESTFLSLWHSLLLLPSSVMISCNKHTALSEEDIMSELLAACDEFSCWVCSRSKLFFLIRLILDCWECKRWLCSFWLTNERFLSYSNRSWLVTNDLLTSYLSFVFIIWIITTTLQFYNPKVQLCPIDSFGQVYNFISCL